MKVLFAERLMQYLASARWETVDFKLEHESLLSGGAVGAT